MPPKVVVVAKELEVGDVVVPAVVVVIETGPDSRIVP